MELPEPRPSLERLPAVQPRRNPRAARWALGLLAAVSSILFAVVVKPFWAPLLLAAVLAAVLQGTLDKVERAFKGRRSLAAGAISLGVLIVIAAPLASIATFAASEATSGFDYLRDTLGVNDVRDLKDGALPPKLEALLDRGLKTVHLTKEQLRNGAATASDKAREIAPELLATSGRAIFHTIIMLLAFFFLLIDGRRLTHFIRSTSPLARHQTDELLEEFHRSATGSIVGNLVTALAQGLTAGIGFAIFHVPHAAFFGLLTAIASFIPVVGTALVSVPAIAVLALSGHRGAATGLAIWYVVAVVGVEHIAKPFILRVTSGGEMHTGLMFLALLGGLEVFGLLGMILGPLIVSFFVAIMRMIEREAVPLDS